MQHFVLFTLKQRVVLNLLFVLLMVVGAFTLLRMPVERYPNIQFGKMYINTFLPGASASDVETLVTTEIEKGLEDLEEVEYIRSVSYGERSNIVIKFVDDSDYEKRFDDVRLKVLSIVGDLPDRAEPPVFNFLDVNDWFPTISVNVAGRQGNSTLTDIAETVKIPLAQIEGVKEVTVSGDYTREFHLILSRDKLRASGMTFQDVAAVLRKSNVSFPAGYAATPENEFIVRVDEQFSSREELLAAVLRRDSDGSFVRLQDVVEAAYYSYQDPFLMTSLNGEDCVTLHILKDREGNALFIADAVRDILKKAQPAYTELGVSLAATQDSSTKIEDSIRVLGINLLLGILLVCTIIWLFMGFRNAALITIGIPFSFLVTLVLMYMTGNSINEVSLFAFVLVSGIIVDDAIVVVENMYRHYQSGKSLLDAITEGTAEVFLPVFAATLTTIVAFLPMLIMTGMVGDFFAIIPKTIAFALLASLFECLVILPCHYLDFGPRQRAVAPAAFSYAANIFALPKEGLLMGVTRWVFTKLILLVLRFRVTCLLLVAAVFIGAVTIFLGSVQGKTSLVRIKFFPEKYSLYYVEITGPQGTSLAQTNVLVKKVAARLAADGRGQVESALGYSGYYINEDFSPQYGRNLGYVAVTLPPPAARRFADYPENDVVAHLEDVRQKVQTLLPGGFTLAVRPEKEGPPSGEDLNIRILGQDANNVAALAADIGRFLRDDKNIAPWLVGLKDDQGGDARVFRIKIDQERAAEYGFTVEEVATLAASAMDGQIIGEMKRAEESIDIRLKVDRGQGPDMFSAMDLEVVNSPAGAVRLRDLCQPVFSLEPSYLNRFQRQRAITLTANLQAGAPITSPVVVNRVDAYYASVRAKYSGASLIFAGEHESTQKSFLSLAYAFIIALIAVYLILAAQFQSSTQPLIVIAAVIFALTGVILGTVFSRTIFTINSFVAVIGVTGVVVNDSLVLVEFINKCYAKGMKRRDALLQATHIRLRPILLTTLTTTLGLLPMALGIPEFSVIWGSMAMTFVTGLCTATFLTIIIIPLLWDMVTTRSDRQDDN
ncbi:efflux RND transporter permease subunit [Desulfopila sp. IMCC35006]|uniref:efflux RND transporter permease subunit n=1 Tax=Desulfopila sp. IMCC35006 TaxID=2569542 RepID=UPI0010AC3E9B|nr:efflux RND transporter permease subunit [Desulfopila sp. IMCC35006]TKB23257.1 efflux RND transporter permease subunit [Desulfopila sp. IMCC35006]